MSESNYIFLFSSTSNPYFTKFKERIHDYIEDHFPQRERTIILHSNQFKQTGDINPYNSVGLVFGDQNLLKEKEILEDIQRAIEKKICILTFTHSTLSFKQIFPEFLLQLLSFGFKKEKEWNSVFHRLFEKSGVYRSNRKIFISYKRSESTSIAQQLYLELSNRKFQVFLDKFNIDYGNVFSDVIKHKIQEFGMLILIESPKAFKSDWIEMEYSIAISNKVPIYVIHWPENENFKISTITKDLPGNFLKPNELVYDVNNKIITELKHAKMWQIMEEVEDLHVTSSIDSIQKIYKVILEVFHLPKYECSALLNGNYVRVQKINGSLTSDDLIFKICPQLPNSEDFFEFSKNLYYFQKNRRNIFKKVIVYQGKLFLNEQKELLDWISHISSVECINIDFLNGDLFG